MKQNRILVDEWRVEIPWHKRQERVPVKVHFRMVACGDSSGKRAAGADLDHLTNSVLPTTIGSGSYSSVRNAVYNVTVAGCRESAMTMKTKRMETLCHSHCNCRPHMRIKNECTICPRMPEKSRSAALLWRHPRIPTSCNRTLFSLLRIRDIVEKNCNFLFKTLWAANCINQQWPLVTLLAEARRTRSVWCRILLQASDEDFNHLVVGWLVY